MIKSTIQVIRSARNHHFSKPWQAQHYTSAWATSLLNCLQSLQRKANWFMQWNSIGTFGSNQFIYTCLCDNTV